MTKRLYFFTSPKNDLFPLTIAIIININRNFVGNLPKTRMKSLRELYRIGKGPSSSHTMGPQKAAQTFAAHHPDARGFAVTLYGSLAATGRGHMTDVAIREVLEPIAPLTIDWQPARVLPFHPNGMKYVALDKNGNETDEWTVYSVGGGALSEGDEPRWLEDTYDVYDKNTLHDIQTWCEKHGRGYWEYVEECEGEGIWDYLQEVWTVMQEAVERGLDHEGALPGPLNLPRKGPKYYVKASGYKQSLQSRALVYAYALSVSEENASGGTIVTAPTCGSCGVMPGVLYYLSKSHNFSDTRILHALATAGIFGNIVKQNASISGAEVGCQGEVGVACAMASAATCQLFGGSPSQIEYAAEMGLEHHLGMTCDPVCGLVQIPCIERNAFAATRALDANLYASFSDGKHSVSFDHVVTVMKQTGHDLPSLYKETSQGGLARAYESFYKNKD
jgi:L-serine dehydratase